MMLHGEVLQPKMIISPKVLFAEPLHAAVTVFKVRKFTSRHYFV